ncbi:uncharacterized protein CcaverHIS019_0506010 [Cutaneotrichosporon cavernicola]|uniref:Isy1-domain-containing protein n=1 Tax=Cutaneotrichosporon cavernicola TaxID=279322 RepID=A0AA48QX34_9TREE|nr:uncharacterized protein CcaverHIS019_0506010 [Cutaneotrichosporon cavernicola]BEI92973.1 hypothetical protein CcaverHIS019_0506010 [Cutaneotrichosporon cavernicola]BEJ00749.1 hypothetical protein CcaverHIS631_0506060 [Cutaneotrichosporon cavernicola]BEJ08515.1 hypothetical protein CcaverHIS641_0506090 [Cutaneotrichosporon cavernicola]
MARNSEKAQSMLYRFREQQAVDMGLGDRRAGERRPRVASSVSSLRECERWRGDIMREISRKVSKIQDSSLTNYEIRDLNDEINQLLKEKRHWESQIVGLGGANYKRANMAMVDNEGREVPGTRGYKYFGRARELPGVKEMFEKGAKAATEESARNASFQMFRNQGTDYYGDLDEMDPSLAGEEDAAARRDWEEASRAAAELLGVDAELPYPEPAAPPPLDGAGEGTKRKSPEPDEEVKEGKGKKRGKKGKKPPPPPPGGPSNPGAAQVALFMSVFDPRSLGAPEMPDTEGMGQILLERRKDKVREQYGV